MDADVNGAGRIMVFMPVRDVRAIDTWWTAGLCGTGSHDIEAADVLCPARRMLPFPFLTRRRNRGQDWGCSPVRERFGCRRRVEEGHGGRSLKVPRASLYGITEGVLMVSAPQIADRLAAERAEGR